jgi:hypothetical protein
MKHLELHRFKKAIGAITFGIFFPNENKRLEQKHGVGKQLDLVLVFVPEGKQTTTVSAIRNMTGWTVKKATAFVKEGDYPKVVTYNVNPSQTITIGNKIWTIESYIESSIKNVDNIIFEIY